MNRRPPRSTHSRSSAASEVYKSPSLNRINTERVAIWFGILVLIVVEVGLITPPVGMNLFIINAMDRKTPMVETYKAVLFFVASDIVRIALLFLFPAITLVLIPW